MSVTMVRQKVKDGSVEEAEAAARDLFATLDRVRPEGVRYASTRVVDSSTFVILLELADGIEDPRPAIPELLRFLAQLKGWVDGPPVIEHLGVDDSTFVIRPGKQRSGNTGYLLRTISTSASATPLDSTLCLPKMPSGQVTRACWYSWRMPPRRSSGSPWSH